jgi:hypothetical protein
MVLLPATSSSSNPSSSSSTSSNPSQSAPYYQTPEDVARDLVLAVSLAREEADRAMAIQLSGGQKPSEDKVAAKWDPATKDCGGWKLEPPPDTEPAEDDPTKERPQTPPPPPPQPDGEENGCAEARRTLNALRVTAATRAVFVGGCAGLLSGVAVQYLVGYSISVDWLGQDSLYHEPPLYSVASAVLYGFVFLLGVLGMVAAWRRSAPLATAYAAGLAVALLCRILLCAALTVVIGLHLPQTLLLHGCWSSQQGLDQPWTAAECAQYRAEATATASLWGFSVVLLCVYIGCAFWLRTAFVRYERAMAPGGPRGSRTSASSPNDTIDDLEATLGDEGAFERPTILFNDAQPTVRGAARRLGDPDGGGPEKELIGIVPEPRPTPSPAFNESVRFTPVCPPPPAHTVDRPQPHTPGFGPKGDAASSFNHPQVATWTAADFEGLLVAPFGDAPKLVTEAAGSHARPLASPPSLEVSAGAEKADTVCGPTVPAAPFICESLKLLPPEAHAPTTADILPEAGDKDPQGPDPSPDGSM